MTKYAVLPYSAYADRTNIYYTGNKPGGDQENTSETDLGEKGEGSLNVDLLLLNQNILDNIDKDYTISVYYQKDFQILKYMNFIGKYVLYKLKISKQDQDISHKIATDSKEYPCAFNNLTDYYENTVRKHLDNIDCMDQLCSIIDCKDNDYLKEYYISPKEYFYLPNCLCVPLFCFDHNTIVDAIPDFIKPIYSNVYNNLDYRNSSLLFNQYQTRDLKEDNGKTLNTFVWKLQDTCRFNFTMRDATEELPFQFKVLSFEATYQSNIAVSFVYLYLDKPLFDLLNNFKHELSALSLTIIIIYSVILLLVGLLLLKWFHVNVNGFKDRINDMKNIHKLIINNENKVYNKQTLESKAQIIARNLKGDGKTDLSQIGNTVNSNNLNNTTNTNKKR